MEIIGNSAILRLRMLQVSMGAIFGALMAQEFASLFLTQLVPHLPFSFELQQNSPWLDVLFVVMGWIVGGMVGGIFGAIGGHLINKFWK